MSQFYFPIVKKICKYGGSPNTEDAMIRWSTSLFNWPNYMGEKGRTLGKTYGNKVRCYWEPLGEHIKNLMRTHWELEGNILGTKEK
jgi:hypothetical protein